MEHRRLHRRAECYLGLHLADVGTHRQRVGIVNHTALRINGEEDFAHIDRCDICVVQFERRH